jgi:hypothetical protein
MIGKSMGTWIVTYECGSPIHLIRVVECAHRHETGCLKAPALLVSVASGGLHNRNPRAAINPWLRSVLSMLQRIALIKFDYV